MAFFKSRKGGDDQQTASAAQPESVEVLRRRAKNRLIGSAILVLIGVIGFPLLVDKQPRPVAVDLPIEIPDRNKVLPLAAPAVTTPEAAPAAPSAAASGPVTEASAPAPEKPAAKPDTSAPKPEAKTETRKAHGKPAADTRYVVQVGSFADEGRAREARGKIERAGLKNYTQVIETKEGRRIRVRAGPFANKAEAERAADKLRKLDLLGTVLSL